MKSTCQYTPAINRFGLPGTTKDYFENHFPIKNKFGDDIGAKVWKLGNSFFYHPNILMSAFYGMSIPNFRDRFELSRKDNRLIIDSGGFEILKRPDVANKKGMDALSVLKWQEEVADIALSLDVPPVARNEADAPTGLMSFEDFKICAKKSYDNNIIYEKNRTNFNMKLYKIIQTGDFKRIDYWWNMMEEFKWDGISIAPKPSREPMKVAFDIGFILDKGIKENVHILGTSGFKVLPTIVYASRFIKDITFDTSSYKIGAVFRKFFNPLHPSSTIFFGDKFYLNSDLIEPPCICPVCECVDSVDILNGPGSFPGALISFHNLYIVIKEIEILKRLSTNKNLFLRLIEEKYPPMTLKSIEFIDSVIEKGFEKSVNEYRHYFNQSHTQVKYGVLE